MSTPFFTAADAADLVQIRHDGDATSRLFWADSYVVWRLDRPAMTWDVGSAGEGWHPVTQSAGIPTVGRLFEGGAAGLGDQDLGGVITNLTPYRFRMDKLADITDDDMLVVGSRVFLVQTVVRTDQEADSMWVYLTERAGDDVPTEVVP